MDYLDLILTFHQKYAKRWYTINNVLFFRFLISSLLIVLIAVLYIANSSFNQDAIYRELGDKYKEYIVGIYDTYETSSIEFDYSDIEKPVRKPIETAIRRDIARPSAIQKSNTKDHSDLLFDSEDFEILSYDIESIAPPTRFYKQTNRRRSDVFDSVEDPLLGLGEYKIYRDAALYIDIQDYMFEEKTNFIHRNQEDVLRVIYSKSGIIESCYQKAARINTVRSGFVKVEFQIAASGYVLPASIRILDSNIRNKSVEQCIKKNIRRWRNFKKLEDNDGIAHVVHKFVFN